MKVALDEQCVIRANEQFWRQMVAMILSPVSLAETCCIGAGHVVASVDLMGAWQGQIELRIAGMLAYQATAAMMMQAPDTVAIGDVLDASKEIANMIAGGIKPSLPRPSIMSVPESAMASDQFCSQNPTSDDFVVLFRHATGDMLVRIVER